MNNELNEKLAKWAGFDFWKEGSGKKIGKLYELDVIDEREYFHYPDGEWDLSQDMPDFINSLDACFKWLVPKIPRFMRVDLGLFTRWYCLLHQYKGGTSKLDYINEKDLETDCTAAVAETPTLAFCLAIEKLIDKELLNEQ